MSWGRSFLLAASVALAAPSARALPVTFTVDPAQTTLLATLENLVVDTQAVGVAGAVAADVDFGVDASFGLVATSLRLDAGALGLSDFTLTTIVPGAIDLTASSSGLGLSLSGPAAAGAATAPGTSLFDLEGSVLTLDAGSVGVTGNVLATPVDFSIDLANVPLPLVFGAGSFAEVVAQDLGINLVGLTLTFPVDVSISIVASDIETILSLAGDTVLTGIVVIPEPGTGALLGVALSLFAAVRLAHAPAKTRLGHLPRRRQPVSAS